MANGRPARSQHRLTLLRSASKRINWIALVLAALGLSILFFAVLFALTELYPHFTGHSLKIEWPVFIAALVPVALVILLGLLARSQTVTAKVGNWLQVQFSNAAAPVADLEVFADANMTEKGGEYELAARIEDVRRSGQTPRILKTRIAGRRTQSRIEFMVLRDYVFGLAQVSPLRYLVFVDDDEGFLAYTTAEAFQKRYPKSSIERLLDDAVVNRDEDAAILFGPLLNSADRDLRAIRSEVRERVRRRYWSVESARGENSYISREDLDRLGASTTSLMQPTVAYAYQTLVALNVPGVPLTDSRGRFLGMLDKAQIEEQVVVHLLVPGQSEGAPGDGGVREG